MSHPNVVRIVIKTTDAAFEGETWRNEVAFILAGIQARLLGEDDYANPTSRLHDTNGNLVGTITAGKR